MGAFKSAPPLVELSHIPDVFVSGIARIEKLGGGMVRVTFYAEQQAIDGTPERVVVAKIVRPFGTWAIALRQIANAISSESPLLADDGLIHPLDS